MPDTMTPARVAVTVVVVAMLAMWAYVTYLAFGPGRAEPFDRLDHPGFAVQAEARCARGLAVLDALPTAAETGDAVHRAEVLDVANRELDALLADLEALVPDGEDGRIVEAWLADWRTYLGDRQEYADRLRVDPRARLLVTAKGGRHITRAIDDFAADNRMTSCETPPDV